MAHVEARLCALVSVRRLYTVCYYRRAPPPPHRGATASRRHRIAAPPAAARGLAYSPTTLRRGIAQLEE
ncbi:RNA-binding protein fusilli [Frankliniella fusca]|uniref:RNA-binding protein fusilli n=1 Tax=Frankliniella fusca TaxID=407009 RepID=A0AAE1I3A1_9NEOP|nr:RNA-binding protein fusilli [Frankliniella fusca]